MIEISALHIYPVKSLRGIDLQESTLTVRGLDYDRNWMITDSEWNFLTQREIPKMATLDTHIQDEALILRHSDFADLITSQDNRSNEVIKTKVWRDECEVFDEGSKVSEWLTTVLGEYKGNPLRLVKMSSHYRRSVGLGSSLNHADSHTALADAYPFLMVSVSSLARVNANLKKDGVDVIPMDRFRPNIVIKGIPEFSEYNTKDLRNQSSQYSLGLRKPCQRCKMTTINQQSGDINNVQQPLRTLAEMNPFKEVNGAFFGQYAILLSGKGETIRVGDQLSYMRAQ